MRTMSHIHRRIGCHMREIASHFQTEYRLPASARHALPTTNISWRSKSNAWKRLYSAPVSPTLGSAALDILNEAKREAEAPGLADSTSLATKYRSSQNITLDVLRDLSKKHNADPDQVIQQLSDDQRILTFPEAKDESIRGVVLLDPELLQKNLSQILSLSLEQNVKFELKQYEDRLSLIQGQLNTIENKAAFQANMVMMGGLFTLSAQFGVFVYTTYFVFGWDIMEAFTYFTGQTMLMGAYFYFLMVKRDHSLESMWVVSRDRFRARLLEKYHLNAEEIENIQKNIELRQKMLMHAREEDSSDNLVVRPPRFEQR